MKVEAIRRFGFNEVETLVFAGGGNRCWWQAGVLRHLIDRGMRLPMQLVGTSAGAAVADPDIALDACLRLHAQTPRIFQGLALPALKLKFAISTSTPPGSLRFSMRITLPRCVIHRGASRWRSPGLPDYWA